MAMAVQDLLDTRKLGIPSVVIDLALWTLLKRTRKNSVFYFGVLISDSFLFKIIFDKNYQQKRFGIIPK